MITRWGVDVPEASDLPTLPIGVVLHWTGGAGKANHVDLAAYHYVIERDGTVRQGSHPVAANMRRVAGLDYARHTGGFNSFRVGISAAGMLGYEGPGNVGPHPLTMTQVIRMCELAAYFIRLGQLDARNPKHLCTHREVWTIHGVKGTRNDQKRDIEHLPPMPSLKPDEVGPYLREATALVLEDQRGEAAPVPVLEITPEVVTTGDWLPGSVPMPHTDHVEVPVRTLPALPPEPKRPLLARILTPFIRRTGHMAIVASKPFWQSKTLWLNALAVIASVLGALNGILPNEYIVAALGVVNFLLRFFTDKPVTASTKPQPKTV